MPENVFPLKPPHLLANGPEFSTPHCLRLYRGQTTGRWLNVPLTSTGPGSDGRQESTSFTLPQLDASGFGEVTLRFSRNRTWTGCSGTAELRKMAYPVPLGEWPLLVPPTSLSDRFTTRAGPDGPPAASVRPNIAGGNTPDREPD